MEHVDLLIVLPLNDADGIEMPESEDPELRDAMNDRLLDLIATNDYDLLGASLRVVEGALVVVSGVMGVEVNTTRVWNRAEELELSRVVFVNMLDRERADFFRTLDSLKFAFEIGRAHV